MSKSINKNDRPDRRQNFTMSPLMLALRHAFRTFKGQSKPSSTLPTKNKEEANTISSIRFEAIEPRVLLSGDVNPAALTAAGSIGVQGEQDHYEFTVEESHRVVFDSLTNRPDLSWQLEGPAGQVANRSFSATDYSYSPFYELAVGQYRLTVDGYQDAIGDYALRIIDAEAAAELTPGTNVNATLDVGRKTAVYKFTATAGDSFFLKAGTSSEPARWRLIDPFGRQEGSIYNLASDRDTFSVQRSGEYLLLVEGSISNSTALSYQFNLQPVTHSTEPLALNTVATVTIDQAGKIANFTFEIGEVTPILFDKLTNDDFYWTLTGPKGDYVGNRYAYDNEPYDFDGFERLVLTPGTYTLSVDLSGSTTGSFPFRLLSGASAQNLSVGTATAGALDLARGTQLYKVTLNEGDQVFLDGRSVSGGSVAWRLIDPYGVRLAGSNLTSIISPFAANVTGDYWLVLNGSDNNTATASVGYDFSLNVVPDIIKTLIIGQVASDSIPTAGQAVVYEFNLASATQLAFDAQSNRSDLLWSLTGPRGAEATNRYFTQSDSVNGSSLFTVPAGNYRLLVKGVGRASGAFAFKLLDLADAAALTLNAPVIDKLEPGNSTKAYRLDAVAGQKIMLQSNGVTGGSASWRLIDRFGKSVTSTLSLSSNSTEIILDLGGAYTLLVEGRISTTTPIDFNVQLNATGSVVPITLPAGEPLSFGSVIAGTLPTWDATKVYRFTLDSDKQIVMDTQSNASSVLWSLVGPRGKEIDLQSLFTSDSNYRYPVLNLLAGDYALTLKGAVSSGAYSGSGAYAFQLFDSTAFQTLTLGQPISATRSPANSTLGYRINATAGSNLVLNKTDSIGGIWRLVDPYGSEVTGFTSANEGTTYSVTITGAYTLLNEGHYRSTGASNIAITLSEQTSASHALIFNDQMTGSLAGRQSIAEYSFTLGEPLTTIVLDALDTASANAANVQWRLSGPKGVISGWRGLTASDTNSSAIISLPAGRYTIALRNTQDANADYKFRILGSDAGAVLQTGISVDDISDVGQTKLYRFNANAGERYYFDGQNNYYGSNEFNSWYLVDPFGRNVAAGTTYYDTQDISLATTGEYLLAVFPQTNLYSPVGASRNIKFNLVAKLETTAVLTLNDDVTGSISQPGQTVRYSFTLAAPTTLVVDTGVETTQGALWSLTGPRGSEVSLRNFGGAQTTAMPLPAGTYEYTVTRNDLATETFNFRLLELSHLPALEINQSTHLVLAADGYAQAHRINVIENGKFIFNPGAFSNYRSWRILDTFGNTRYSGEMYSASEPFALAKGQYVFTVDGSQSQESTFDFSLLQLTTKTSTISLDAEVAGTLGVPGQRAEFNFHLNTPTTVLFDSLTNSADIRLTLVGPNGTLFTDKGLKNFETYSSTVSLTVVGDYKLIVSSLSNSVANFGFNLHDLSALQAQALSGPQTINLNPGNSSRIFAFNAQAGDFLDYKSSGLNAGQANVYVLNEQGGMEVSPHGAQYNFGATLSSSKKYYLVIEGAFANIGQVTFGADVQIVRNLADPVSYDYPIIPLEFNSLTEAAVSAGNSVYYAFHVDTSSLIGFDSLTSNNNLSWQLTGPTGQVFSQPLGYGYPYYDAVRNLPAGNYQLKITNSSTVQINASFRVLDGASAIPVLPGNVVTTSVSPSNGLQLYSFSANAGERYYVDALMTASSILEPYSSAINRAVPRWRLLDPQGRVVFSTTRMGNAGADYVRYDSASGQNLYQATFNGYDQEPTAFTASGLYTLVLEGANSETRQLANVAFNIVKVPEQPAVVLDSLVLRPAPDLTVNRVNLSPANGLHTGDWVNVSWVVENRGLAPTSGNWNDRIIVRNLDTGLIVANLTIPYDASELGNGSIPIGEARVRSINMQLPEGVSAAGRLSFTVLTDADNVIKESNLNAVAESNNAAVTELTVSLAAYVDLVIESLSLNPSSDFQPNQTVYLNWSTANRGNKAADQAWSERLELHNLSTNALVASVLVQDTLSDGSLEVNGIRQRSAQINWPNGVSASGRFSLRIMPTMAIAILRPIRKVLERAIIYRN